MGQAAKVWNGVAKGMAAILGGNLEESQGMIVVVFDKITLRFKSYHDTASVLNSFRTFEELSVIYGEGSHEVPSQNIFGSCVYK
jgi:hypothetical protein